MATDSNTTSNATADQPDLGHQITSNLAGADEIGSQRVETLAWVQQARAAQLTRTAASLKAEFGAGDSRVKIAEAAARAAKATAAQVSVVRHQVTTADPPASTKGWALHGRVFNSQLAPESGYTVFLVDGTKTFQQAYGFAYTDNTGYFLLNYSGSDVGSGETLGAGSAKRTSRGATHHGTTPELFVEVADPKARPVFLSATAFQPMIGQATYQTIVLPAGQQPIGDPPREIRDVAIPKTGKPKKS